MSLKRFLLFTLLSAAILHANDASIKIGVLAKRSTDIAHAKWDATAQYLSRNIPSHTFEIVPLGFDELRHSVETGSIDFVLTNPMYYVDLEYRFGISRISTLVNKDSNDSHTTRFGSVIFTRADTIGITNIRHIKSRTFGAVDPLSFGGWVMAQSELTSYGIDKDEISLSFFNSHDAVVKAVLDGTVEAGTVRSDTIERMANEKKIDLSTIKIIAPKSFEGFPFFTSTALYPEWPFAKLQKTPLDLSNNVLSALLKMRGDEKAAQDASIAGWTIPLDYTAVHDTLKKLRIAPYEGYGEITFAKLYENYRYGIYLFMILFSAIIAALVYISTLNRSLRQQKDAIGRLNSTLEDKVRRRTQKVNALLDKETRLREELDDILDFQENIIFLSDGQKLLRANRALMNAIGFENLESFYARHNCLCEFLEHDEGYLHAADDRTWIEYVIANSAEKHKVKMFHKEKNRYRIFLIKASEFPGELHSVYVVSLTDISDLEQDYMDISEQAMTDELTGIYNRHKFNGCLEKEFDKALRKDTVFSIILFDIDNFKQVNDTYGHDTGDYVLQRLSEIVKNNIRESDIFTRWGGEEFILLLPGVQLKNAYKMADKFRLLVSKFDFKTVGTVTCSFGVAQYKHGKSKEQLIKMADERLYLAKKAGKNRVRATSHEN